MAADAQENNDFFTKVLGLRRVKKTVNFDAPDVYHLYYGGETGSAGTVMTYFPFPHIAKGRRGAGEVAKMVFSVPQGTLGYWQERLGNHGVAGLGTHESFGRKRLRFLGPDGDRFALAEAAGDARAPYAGGPVPVSEGVHGFQGVTLRLRDDGATGELLKFMDYEAVDRQRVYHMADLAARIGKMAGFVQAHREAHPGAPVYGLGYSNGANILAAVILAEPELFDRAVLMHPLIPWTPAPAPGLRGREILIAAGRRDPICPLPLANGLAAYLEGQGARVELALHDGGHEIRQVKLAGITRFLQREAVAPA